RYRHTSHWRAHQCAHQGAHQRAHHFPKDVRSIGNGAHTILPAAHTILGRRAHHFARRRKSFFDEEHPRRAGWSLRPPGVDPSGEGGRLATRHLTDVTAALPV